MVVSGRCIYVCVCVCVFGPIHSGFLYLPVFAGKPAGVTEEEDQTRVIFSFFGLQLSSFRSACLTIYSENGSAVPFPGRQ